MQEVWMEFAISLAFNRGECKKARVGCVIVNENIRTLLGNGYNGGPAKTDYDCQGGQLCKCVHAEMNAMIDAGKNKGNLVMFVTMFPCLQCAILIINAGVKLVYYHTEYKDGSNHWKQKANIDNWFKQAGITVIQL